VGFRRRPSGLCALSFSAFVLLGLANRASAQIGELKRMSLEELSSQEVTSVSKKPEPYGSAPAAIQVITRDDIRRSGATTLAEALRLADNLTVAQKNAHDWAISARGFATDLVNKLLVMIDGRTVYSPLFSGVFWDRQDYLLEDIERIEVISGPGGTLWGANAVNGIINIITRSAGDSQGLYADGGLGTKIGVGGVRYGGKLAENTPFRIYGKYADHDNELLPDGTDASDSWRLGQGGFRVDAAPAARDALTLQGDFYGGRTRLGTGGTGEVSGGNALARWARTLSEDSSFSLQLYYDRTHLRLPVPAQVLSGLTLAPAGVLTDDLDTYDADFHHRFRAGRRHDLTWGLGYRFTHDDVGNAPALAFVPALLNQSLFSAFAQDEMTISKTLVFTAGTKLEHNAYTGLEAEPSARLQWSPTPARLVWGAVSRAIRAPARVDRDERLGTPGLSPFVDNLLIGGADFVSETLLAYEIGFRAQLGEAATVSTSAFYNRYDNLRSTSLSPPDPVLGLPFPLFFENNLEGHTQGIEISATGQVLPWWRLHAGYSFIGEDIRAKPGRTDLNNALNETADPPHRFSLRSSMSVGSRAEADAAFRWVDSFRFNNAGVPGIVPSYGELNGRLAWFPITQVELSLNAQNLLHDHHSEYVISSPNPRGDIGRRAYVKAALRW
jgi:iron complex outermembrane receptor protein